MPGGHPIDINAEGRGESLLTCGDVEENPGPAGEGTAGAVFDPIEVDPEGPETAAGMATNLVGRGVPLDLAVAIAEVRMVGYSV
jgi:hypothetical protein